MRMTARIMMYPNPTACFLHSSQRTYLVTKRVCILDFSFSYFRNSIIRTRFCRETRSSGQNTFSESATKILLISFKRNYGRRQKRWAWRCMWCIRTQPRVHSFPHLSQLTCLMTKRAGILDFSFYNFRKSVIPTRFCHGTRTSGQNTFSESATKIGLLWWRNQ